MTNIERSKTL